METLQWNEVLATGIAEIDEQHKRIVDMTNEMRQAIERREHKATEWVLLQLVDYTVYHFEFEERLMERSGYQFLPLHRRVHELFTRRIPKFQQRYVAGEDVMAEVHDMLVRWLRRHIQHDDRDYASAVKSYLKQEANRFPANYAKTEPLPLGGQVHDTAPSPIEHAEQMARKRTRRSFMERLAGSMRAP